MNQLSSVLACLSRRHLGHAATYRCVWRHAYDVMHRLVRAKWKDGKMFSQHIADTL
jgi:hypothetical protein